MPANAAPRSSTSSSTAASAAFVRAAMLAPWAAPKRRDGGRGVVFVQGGIGTRPRGKKKRDVSSQSP